MALPASSSTPESATAGAVVQVACSATPSFELWLAHMAGSIAITTYQAGKVAVVGWNGVQPTLLMRQFDKPMGLACQDGRLALATRREVVLFANAPLLAPEYLEHDPGRYDALYLPRARFLTGDINVHDVVYDSDGVVIVNTRFSCLARLSVEYGFEPFWRPKFVSDLVPEDRCHLNGAAVCDGKVRFVTCLGTSDSAGGWRENKARGGVIWDVSRDEPVLQGLCMPHSPRWHLGQLWFLNSGSGELCAVDLDRGNFKVVASLPGYLRGMAFVGPYVLVGMSKIRERHIFGGMPVAERHAELRCGVAVVDTRSGLNVGEFLFTQGCEEVFEVQFLPGMRRAMIVHAESHANVESITHPESSWWLRPSKEIHDVQATIPEGGPVAGALPTRGPAGPLEEVVQPWPKAVVRQ